MDLQAKIDEFKAKTKEIKQANPEVNTISWRVENIPYKEFKHFFDNIKEINDPSMNRLGDGRLFYVPYYGWSEGFEVTFVCVPVKVKTLYEIEELPYSAIRDETV